MSLSPPHFWISTNKRNCRSVPVMRIAKFVVRFTVIQALPFFPHTKLFTLYFLYPFYRGMPHFFIPPKSSVAIGNKFCWCFVVGAVRTTLGKILLLVSVSETCRAGLVPPARSKKSNKPQILYQDRNFSPSSNSSSVSAILRPGASSLTIEILEMINAGRSSMEWRNGSLAPTDHR